MSRDPDISADAFDFSASSDSLDGRGKNNGMSMGGSQKIQMGNLSKGIRGMEDSGDMDGMGMGMMDGSSNSLSGGNGMSSPPSSSSSPPIKLYSPADFAHLPCPPDVAEIFSFIMQYNPMNIELDTKIKPFIPDFIPSVGDIDTFVKIPFPAISPQLPSSSSSSSSLPSQDQFNDLGLSVLDEPSAHQSDPTVLEIQLRNISKQSSSGPQVVRSIENAEKNPRKITAWIQNIDKIHHDKPAVNFEYKSSFPSTDSLMAAWPTEFESFLNSIDLPVAHYDCDTKEFAKMICNILDIPVQGKVVESLNVLFNLYLEFKQNAHFNQN